MSVQPAVEVDLHPEGAVPLSLIRDMAAARHLDISGVFAPGGGYAFKDEAGSRRVAEAIATVLIRPEDYQRMMRALVEDCLANNVIYSEILLRPDRLGGDLAAWAEVLAAHAEVAGAAETQGLTLRFAARIDRAVDPAVSRSAAICAAETSGGLLTGFALTGPEGLGSLADHAWSFDCAREAGLRLSVEARTPAVIREALSVLRPDRLAGASSLADDPALVEQLAEAGIAAVLCPAADIAFGRAASWRAHPAGRLYDRGARMALVSGSPAFFSNTPAGDRDRLETAFGWDDGVFRTLAETALAAAFCDAPTRARLVARLGA